MEYTPQLIRAFNPSIESIKLAAPKCADRIDLLKGFERELFFSLTKLRNLSNQANRLINNLIALDNVLEHSENFEAKDLKYVRSSYKLTQELTMALNNFENKFFKEE